MCANPAIAEKAVAVPYSAGSAEILIGCRAIAETYLVGCLWAESLCGGGTSEAVG
jgi:hypothetical protein